MRYLALIIAGCSTTACIPTDFEDLRGLSSVITFHEASGYPADGYGTVVAGYSGSLGGTFQSRIATSAGVDSPFSVLPILRGDMLEGTVPSMDGCDTAGPCPTGSGESIVGFARWNGEDVCLALSSPTEGQLRVRCESNPLNIDLRTVPAGERFGASADAMEGTHPFGIAVFGAPRGGSWGAIYRLPQDSAPVAIDVSAAAGAGTELGSAIAVTPLDASFALVAASATRGATRRVVVASGDTLTTTVRACIDSTTAPFGDAIALGDLNGDGVPELAVSALDAVRVYDGATLPTPGGACADWPLAVELSCPMVDDVDCEAGSEFGFALAIGDVDGDGIGDLIAGAPGADVRDVEDAGAVFVFQGGALGTLASGAVALYVSVPGSDDRLGGRVGDGPRDGGHGRPARRARRGRPRSIALVRVLMLAAGGRPTGGSRRDALPTSRAELNDRKQILVADDELNLRRVLTAQLARDGYDVFAVEDGQEALEAMGQHHIDVLISDLRMPKMNGMELLKRVVSAYPDVPVIIITAHGTVDTAVEALKLGAFDYITKPFEQSELRNVVGKAARTRELSQRDVAAEPSEPGRYRLIGQSPPMAEVYGVIEKVADTPSTVLITGESGTGKELIARALHENSSRRARPFIRVNCAAIPRDLIESELFGYEKGAFTGAVTSKPGRFELAHGGTLFLDEIGEIPVNMQVKLLRAIQEQEFERVGGIKTIEVDVRLVAATNRELAEEIKAGRFREDLYYRLNVVQVRLPPLRERTSDIPLLVEHFIVRFRERLKKEVDGVTESAMDVLLKHPWPGNIRELENVVERCLLFSDGNRITVADLPGELTGTPPAAALSAATTTTDDDDSDRPTPGLKEAVREVTMRVERELIVRALGKTGGNVTHTARLLKISRKSLQTKMKELGLREGG